MVPSLSAGRRSVRARLLVPSASLLFVACGGGKTVPPPPGPVEVDVPAPAMEHAGDWDAGWEGPEAPGPVELDPILHSRYATHPELQEDFEAWVERYVVRQPEWFATYLTRLGRWGPMVDSVLAEKGAPSSLRYLPIVESGYSPYATSRVAAAGMWQFMPSVARSMGMQVDRLVDERRDPHLSTPAAIQYLVDLEERFDSWFLALAAYNGGPTRVSRLIRRHAPLSPLSDSLYLVIRPHLPRETREFVPKFLAAAAVAQNPERFDLGPDGELLPLSFDVVTVPDATTLDVVAEAAGISEDEVRALNPQILRGVTPWDRSTRLRIPLGLGPTFEERYALIPPDRRVTVTEHVVVRGDTLWDIARKYGVATREIEEANPRIRADRLQIGQTLMVPIAGRGSS